MNVLGLGWVGAVLTLVIGLVACGVLGFLCFVLIETVVEQKKTRNPFGVDWGDLPVVKVTGDRVEGRFVETRRINIGDARYETRLNVEGEVVESRRSVKVDDAIRYHDSLCSRNGSDPNKGAAPEWHSIGRLRAIALHEGTYDPRRELPAPHDEVKRKS